MQGKIIDYTGIKIGKINVISLVNRNNGKSYWNCICDCGNTFVGDINNIKYRIEKLNQKYCNKCKSDCFIIHGDAKKRSKKLRLYSIWQGMKARCEKEYASHYKYYGGKGISVCNEWQSYSIFRDWALLNGYNDNLSIERINSDSNYCPENCIWATSKEQSWNTSQVIRIIHKNKEYTTRDLSNITGLNIDLIRNRLYKGWSIEQIINTPHRTIAKRCI